MKYKINEIISYGKKQVINKERLEKLEKKLRDDFNILGDDIYKKVICENELFEMEISFSVWHGASIFFKNKTSKYYTYNVFGSFSWFHEWVSKIYKATEIIDLDFYKDELKTDYSNLEELINKLDEVLKDDYVIKRNNIFFDFISSQVKTILGG